MYMTQITSDLADIIINNNDTDIIRDLEHKLAKTLGIMDCFDNEECYAALVELKEFIFRKGIKAGLSLSNYLDGIK